ncbi:hypothetical protein DUA64_25710 [Salmonella enterica subsp. enterica serovar Abony]|nr:hypothetical protein [Salmonella enterica subsp. enterica serovar Abony]EBY6401589.1 hypothetical protein [Salmonella enterica subsp. enterica serovar Abony]
MLIHQTHHNLRVFLKTLFFSEGLFILSQILKPCWVVAIFNRTENIYKISFHTINKRNRLWHWLALTRLYHSLYILNDMIFMSPGPRSESQEHDQEKMGMLRDK